MEASRLNLGIGTPNSEEQKDARFSKRRKMPKKNPTLASVIRWINRKGLDAVTTNELIKIAKGYPAGALNRFKDDYLKHVKAVHKKNK